jgi:hypothetical protein
MDNRSGRAFHRIRGNDTDNFIWHSLISGNSRGRYDIHVTGSKSCDLIQLADIILGRHFIYIEIKFES